MCHAGSDRKKDSGCGVDLIDGVVEAVPLNDKEAFSQWMFVQHTGDQTPVVKKTWQPTM
jgi:hypothetical protein